MEPHKIVVHYADGRVLKGHTDNFSPAGLRFSLKLVDDGGDGKPVMVELAQVKGLFFVRSFTGNRTRQDRKAFDVSAPFQGRRIKVTFNDGETVLGSAPAIDPMSIGFFLFPADNQANTIKIYVINGNVKETKFL